jgi:DNA-binding NarL/FixJ family response regulator
MESRSERTERLLVAILLQSMKNAPQKDKVIQLNIVGFSNLEIAEFLKTSPQVVAQYLYEIRKQKRVKTRE